MGLKTVTNNSVLLLFDDAYIMGKIDTISIDNIYKKFISEKLDFMSIRYWENSDKLKFEYTKYLSEYSINSSGFFKKDFLLKYLRKNETAWEFELLGTFRSVFLRPNIMSASLFNILPIPHGGVIIKGKKNEKVDFMFLAKEHGIHIDFEKIRISHKDNKLFTSRKTPFLVRLNRKIKRNLKKIVNIYFNSF
jgi:hypothetical protein